MFDISVIVEAKTRLASRSGILPADDAIWAECEQVVSENMGGKKRDPAATLRDQFAMAALTGFIARGLKSTEDAKVLPELAFAMADNMMAARGKK